MRFVAIAVMLACAVCGAQATITIAGPTVVCENATIILTAPAGMISYQWNTGATTQSVTVANAGRYSCRVQLPTGPIDSGSVDIRAGNRPRPRIGNPVEYLCEGDEARLEAPSYFRSYLWNTGETTSSIRVTKAGRYSLTVVDTNGCAGTSDEVEIFITPKPVLNVQGPDALCPNSTATYYTQAKVGVAYQWIVDGGNVLDGQGTGAARILWLRTGTVRLRAISQRPDGGTCVDDTTISVRISTKLKPQIQYARSSLCTGQAILLEAAAGYRSYLWSTGTRAPYITVTKGGQYWVEVTDSSGCTGRSDTLTVLERPLPDVSIVAPRVICEGATVSLEGASRDNNVVFYDWSTGVRAPRISVSAPGTYSVVGWTLDGCTDTASITIVAAEKINIEVPDRNLGMLIPNASYTASVVVRNRSAVNVSVMSIASATLPIKVQPALPRLISAGGTQEFKITFTPTSTGSLVLPLVWQVMSADCMDTITSQIAGQVVGDLPDGTVVIRIPDTVAQMGKEFLMPVYLSWNLSGYSSIGMSFDVTFPNAAFLYQGPRNCREISNTLNYDERTVRLVIDTMFSGVQQMTIYLAGMPMLYPPFLAPVTAGGATLGSNNVNVTIINGSIATEGCWLPARIITLQNVDAIVNIFSVQGAQIYAARHPSLNENELSTIISSLNISRQALIVQVRNASGLLLANRLLFTQQ